MSTLSRTERSARVPVAVGLLLLIVGCPASPGTGEHPGMVAAALASTAEGASGAFELPFDILNATCVSYLNGGTDTDGDGIPDDDVIQVNCSATVGGVVRTIAGTITVSDDNPAVADFNYGATYNLSATSDDGQGNTASASTSASTEASDTGGVYSVDFSGFESLSANIDGDNVTVSEVHAWTVEYTPASAWSPGDALVAGDMSIDGSWTIGGTMGDGVLVLSTSVPLHVDPACAPDVFDSGTLDATAVGPGIDIYEIQWNGCAPFSATLNGQPIDQPGIDAPNYLF